MWIDPCHSIVRLFVQVILCTKYVLSPTRTQPWFKFMKFHVFCVVCINRSPEESCDNEFHVHPWTLKRLKPCNNLEVKNIMFDLDEEMECGIGGEWIANLICVGDNVAMIADNETNEQFWLLLVDKTIHVVHESFEDGWGNS